MAEPEEGGDARTPSFSESLQAAARQSGLGRLDPGEAPSGRAIIAAIGGVRGIVESTVPGIAFLVLFLITHILLISVLVPVAIALIFVVARAGARSPMTSAITGAVGLAVTAALALITNNAVTNFVPGILINIVCLLILLISLAVRWPLIGLVVGLLVTDAAGWREDRPRRRILTLATWLWVGLFALRLVLEVPLFLAGNVPALGVVRLITSVPLYAVFLWVTWLLVRGIFVTTRRDEPASDTGIDES
jgi:hypothetical protein